MAKLIFFFFLLFFFFVTPSMETDVQALLAFKAAIKDDPLGSLHSWNETVHFCSWRGVTCSHRHRDRVVSIDLMSRGLVGSVSPHLGNLSFLRVIILQNNSFRGQIPDEIGRLRRLEYIEFSNNSLSGEIPRNLSQCRNLYYLNLIDNNLTGTIIPELGSLSKLEALGLSVNRFSGTIPSHIGNLASLNQLSLSFCGLEGQIPDSLVRLRTLRFLHLSGNNLTGTFPPGLFNISTIYVLIVRSNQLHGTIPPDAFFTIPNVRFFDFGDNLFSGQIPVSLSNTSYLEAINLSYNDFWGDFSFISSMTNCPKLKYLGVSQNLLNGSLPDSIANLSSQITFLAMDDNEMHGKIPSGIGNLINLNRLHLEGNYLSGPIPSSIGKLVKLQELYLESNRLTNEIPLSLGNLTLLNHIYLGNNSISGRIPQSFSNFNSLLTFDLSHNNLNGSIPRDILSLSSISISFNLAYNEFTGPVPSEVGLLRNLEELDLSNNWLSGVIPSALSSCVALQRLRLEGNSFDGEIPGLSALRGLQDLDLSRNHLSGPIPGFLSELHLLNLNLSFNRLQGEVPTSGVLENRSAISLDGNNDLCGGVSELKLQSCPSSNPRMKKFPKVLKIIIPLVVIGVVSITLAGFLYIFVYKRKMSQKSKTSMPTFKGEVMRLSYGDLLKATGGFSEDNLIGAGRFGTVYKGVLRDDKTMVAVKVLNLNVHGASKSFMAECNALRGIRHRNLVKILSICPSTDFQGQEFKALVFEFKSNGSLEKWLHNNNAEQERKSLSAIQRLNIAIDIAYALEYLHFGTELIVIHGDVKPSNILLDDDMTAYVGDFGLAQVVSNLSANSSPHGSSSIAVQGTVGYVAPEYGMGDKVSTQGDVYSYGILLLEMFTNIRPTDDAFNDNSNLHNFISSALPNSILDILDPNIVQGMDANNNTIKDSLMSVLSIGVECSKEFPRDRMQMTDVVTELNESRTTYLAEMMS